MKTLRCLALVYLLLSMVGTTLLRAQTAAPLPQETPAPSDGTAANQIADRRDFQQGPRGPTDWLRILAISPDGRFFVTTNLDRQTCVREVVSGKTLVELPKNIIRAVFSPDSTMIACEHEADPAQKLLRRWQVYATADARPVSVEMVPATPNENAPNELFFSPDGKLLAGISDGRLYANGQIKFNLWEAATGKYLVRQPAKELSQNSGRMIFSPDGKVLAGFGDGTDVWWWDVPGMKPIRSIPFGETMVADITGFPPGSIHPEPDAMIDAVAFSPDGKLFAVVGSESRLVVGGRGQQAKGKTFLHFTGCLYDVATRKIVTKLKLLNEPSFYSKQIVFIPGGKALVACSRVWSAVNGKQSTGLVGAENPSDPFAVSPDGKTFVAVQRGDLQLYDTRHWRVGLTIIRGAAQGYRQWPLGPVMFSPDGACLIVGYSDTVCTYAMPSGDLRSKHRATQREGIDE